MMLPIEETRGCKFHPHARHLAGVRNDRVFPTRLPRFREPRNRAGLDVNGLSVLIEDDRLSVDDLEEQLVDMNRMRIFGDVVELPHLRVADLGVLRDVVIPPPSGPGSNIRPIYDHCAEKRFGGLGERLGLPFEQRQQPGGPADERGDGRKLQKLRRRAPVSADDRPDAEL